MLLCMFTDCLPQGHLNSTYTESRMKYEDTVDDKYTGKGNMSEEGRFDG